MTLLRQRRTGGRPGAAVPREPGRGLLFLAAVVAASLSPDPAAAEGLLEGFSGDVTTVYSSLSSKTRDPSTGATKIDTATYEGRVNLRLNTDLTSTLRMDAGLTYDTLLNSQSGDGAGPDTQTTRVEPSILLTLQDPILRASAGYDLRGETVKPSGQPSVTLTRQTASANAYWRPTDLPSLQILYNHTITQDDPRTALDTREDYALLRSEYYYGGLKLAYTGTYLRTDDVIRDLVSTQLSHEGQLVYAGSFLDGRVSVVTDDRLTYNELENAAQVPLVQSSGFSALDDTPLDGPLDPNPALADGNLTASAGLNLGFPGLGGDFTRRNLGLAFPVALEVNNVRVWVDGWGPDRLPQDIASAFSWDVYTSSDNLIWTFVATVHGTFGPFDRRFDIFFPAVTTRYLKVVTRPLEGAVVGTTSPTLFPNIFVTEMQAFVTSTATAPRGTATQTLTRIIQNYNLEVKVVLLRTPLLYYRFYGTYYKLDASNTPDAQIEYTVSNGLYLNHRFNPILSASANANYEFGKQQELRRRAVLYYAALTATPLPTLTDTLTVSGNNEWLDDLPRTSNSVILYNTAQLYQGLDLTLNLGATFSSDSQAPLSGRTPVPNVATPPPPPRLPFGSDIDFSGPERRLRDARRLGQETSSAPGTIDRRDLYLNLGLGITPHPSVNLSTYYLGRLSHATGQTSGGAQDTTEHRLDLSLSFTPFPTLFLSAGANITSETGSGTTVLQNYGLSWTPFPDGRLQLSFYFTEDYLPDLSRIIQPTLRWYLDARRRSYLEATYQLNHTESGPTRTDSQLFSLGMRVFF